MSVTGAGLSNPVAVIGGVALLVIVGLISVFRLPIQLTPEVEQPEITIATSWRAAAPEEVEKEIIEPQERTLRGLPGMTEMVSTATRGGASITVTFQVGHDLERGLLDVLNRLQQVSRYPEDADEPILSTTSSSDQPVAWFIIKPGKGNDRDISSYKQYVEEIVQTRFERVPGVARSNVYGGRDEEIRITFDPYQAAALGIQLPVAARLAGGNENVSGGTASVGKRRYTIRFTGAFSARNLSEMVIDWRDGKPILLRDVAQVERRMVDRAAFVITGGARAIATNAVRESGVNVLEVMAGLEEAVDELREGPLKQANLTIDHVYDETIYINQSIEMLRNNLLLGILLAVGVLWWFMRRIRATLMVAMAIPLCLMVAFFVLDFTHHTLNVISLAGLAFAVGMVLDAAIVVLENIVRLRELGMPAPQAAYEGATQVWGALLASTATTVAIFLPILFLAGEPGQLFGELALTISVAIVASLAVAVTVIPVAAQGWLANIDLHDRHENWWQNGTDLIMRITDKPATRRTLIAVLVGVPLVLALWLLPKADYLPEGNRDLVFAFILPPPGVNIDHIESEMGAVIAERIAPYLSGEKQPKVERYFFVAFPGGSFMGARAADYRDTAALIPVVNQAISGFPDTFAFAQQLPLFRTSGRRIDLNLQGRDLDKVLQAAAAGYGMVTQQLGWPRVRPVPGLELAEPELRLIPDERRIAEAGWNREVMGQVIRALGQGLYVGDYFDGEEQLNMIVRVQDWATPEEMASIPLATPGAGVLPLGELVTLERTAGPEQIRRLDRRRTVTLQITPPPEVSLEEGIALLQEKVEPALKNLLPADGTIRYTGAADKLKLALRDMGGSLLFAIFILFILMSALFRSFWDSLLVLVALPPALVGSVLALQLTRLFTIQSMDLLTMIGFVILLGLVVNNAILLVHQTRVAEREGLARREAVEQAVRRRLRPILMSTLTSLFGMLPLWLVPGAGTELYRGLAAVIVGGMAVSTVFTLVLLPSLLRLGEERSGVAVGGRFAPTVQG
ncbi:MAG: efflux RND transporter permease subunit [Gammaproteobacteria bacterium]|nr:efflux RND transporter permease subunit [Gammaproteobacteria bacterium]